MQIFVYVVTCDKNQKQYVGITSRTLEQRFHEHINASTQRHVQTPFYNAIRAHGLKHFTIAQLQECDSWEEACIAEKRCILELNSHVSRGGYNATFGGDGVIGYSPTVEQLKKKSDAQKASPNFKRTPVCQIDSTGRLLAQYRTTQEASIITGAKHINLVLAGKRNSAAGFFWCTPDNLEFTLQEISKRPKPFKTFAVDQLTLDGVCVKTFNTIADAQRETGIRHIYEASLGALKSAGGYLWRRTILTSDT